MDNTDRAARKLLTVAEVARELVDHLARSARMTPHEQETRVVRNAIAVCEAAEAIEVSSAAYCMDCGSFFAPAWDQIFCL